MPDVSVLLPVVVPAAPDQGGASRALVGGVVGVGSGFGSTLAWVIAIAALLLLVVLAWAVSDRRPADPEAARSVAPEADHRDQP